MATIDDIKKLLEDEIRPLRANLLSIEEKFNALQNSMDFFSKKYDDLLKGIQGNNEKMVKATGEIKSMRNDLNKTEKCALELREETDAIAQYLRRDCVEITGVKPTESLSCIDLVKAIGKDMEMDIEDRDISTAHPIPRFDEAADSKIIAKFVRRDVRDQFYSRRKTVAGKKVRSLTNLKVACENVGADLEKKIYISESLTTRRKQLFGSINKLKKDLKWKYIWTNHGRVYLKQGDNSQTYKFDKPKDLDDFKNKVVRTGRI